MHYGVVPMSQLNRFGRWDARFNLAWREHEAMATKLLKLDPQRLVKAARLLPFNQAAWRTIESRNSPRHGQYAADAMAQLPREWVALYVAIHLAESPDPFAAAEAMLHTQIDTLQQQRTSFNAILKDIAHAG